MIHERYRSNIKYSRITAQLYGVQFTLMWTIKYCTIIDIFIRKRILDVSIIGLTLSNYVETYELFNIWAILGNYETISKFNKNET